MSYGREMRIYIRVCTYKYIYMNICICKQMSVFNRSITQQHINTTQNRWMQYNLHVSAASYLRQELTNIAITFLTKAACCRIINIVLHPSALSCI